MRTGRGRLLTTAAAAALCLTLAARTPSAARGVRDPAWSPDGRRLAFSFLDRIWTADPDGSDGRALRADSGRVEREPSWSADGRSIAFAEHSDGGFDILAVGSDGRGPRRVTTMEGDERWPSWTRDGRIVFSHRAADRWRLFIVDAAGGDPQPLFADAAADDDREGRVSPDGRRIAYVSDRDSRNGDADVWIADLGSDPGKPVLRARVAAGNGLEAAPSWSPDGSRIAFFAMRGGAGAVWVASVEPSEPSVHGEAARDRRPPPDPPVLVSRHGGTPAWSPDGRRIAIADIPPPESAYNGNPRRSVDEPPPLFADAFRLWMVDAPLPVDSGARTVDVGQLNRASLTGAFDRVWLTLQRLYYSSGPSADAWEALKRKYRPQAAAARDEAALEAAVDRMIAEQPLIKPAVTSSGAVVVSGHPLASRAGAFALENGGNIVDAAIAVSFALGVVEPEASGIGGDGMAILYLEGMTEPAVIDYKDQVPIGATREHQALQRSAGDGPAAANIPGVVAGMDLLYRRFGSRAVAWADLIAPAIDYAENGYQLDEALPTTIAEARRLLDKYPAARRIFLPGGRVPRPGERFVNRDYAATLRAIAADGAQTFYRGAIARRIAEDMARSGGLITLDDLAQYRAIERRPLAGRYRDHAVFTAPPPVSTGAVLIETLQILQNYARRPGASYASDAEYFHYAIESWKVRDQLPRIADPGLWDVDLGSHLAPSHAAELFRRIDRARASRLTAPGPASTPTTEPDGDRIGRGTTAFAVADADGNMIAVTQTLSTWGGAFYVSDGLGFLYNNHLRFAGGSSPGRFLPLARSSSTTAPTLVFEASSTNEDGPGTPVLAVGAAGNAWIPASVYDVILNVVDAGLPAQRAIEAPRFLVGRNPLAPAEARVQIEDRIARDVLQDLAARGHRFHKVGRKGEVRYGYAAAVVVDTAKREVQGGAEPRRSHAAVAVR